MWQHYKTNMIVKKFSLTEAAACHHSLTPPPTINPRCAPSTCNCFTSSSLGKTSLWGGGALAMLIDSRDRVTEQEPPTEPVTSKVVPATVPGWQPAGGAAMLTTIPPHRCSSYSEPDIPNPPLSVMLIVPASREPTAEIPREPQSPLAVSEPHK